jgi:hypothetical protein
MDVGELIADAECVGALDLAADVAPRAEKKSQVFTYRYPGQDHKFHRGDKPLDPVSEKTAGEIVSLDDSTRTLGLKRGPILLDKAHPRALVPEGPINTAAIRGALQRFAKSVVEQDFASTPYRAGADIFLRNSPRVGGAGGWRDVLDATRRLDDSYLFVQGPPGSGKTYTAARAIVELLRTGKRIGVTSNSHKAIHNLLDEVERVARNEGYWFRGLKKSGSDPDSVFESQLDNPMIEACNDNMKRRPGSPWRSADCWAGRSRTRRA